MSTFFRNSDYMEGDKQYGDIEVPQRPSPNHQWINGAWVEDIVKTKLARIKYINQQADIAFNAITASYPKQEVSTWPNQYAEAWALQYDPLAYTPTLAAIALESNVTVTVLATTVLQKAAAYTQASGLIVGKRKRLTDEINAYLTNANGEVEGIVW